MVRLLHTSDTHLGHAQYPRTDPRTGLNQREQDHYDTWSALIDQAIADPPDLFLHAGDLFDGVRPSNRALAAAMEGFLRLSQAGIETVVIAGNHETPKMRGTGSPFRLFAHLEHIHPVYKGRAETLQLAGATIHAVPQCTDAATLREQVADARRGDGPQILMLHGGVQEIEAFRHAEFNEQTLDPAWFDDRFDYVALGHYHTFTEISQTAWYCGAPDRVSMSESGEQKGCIRATVEARTPPTVDFCPLPVRTYADLPRIDASDLRLEEVEAAARQALERVPAGAVARLRLDHLDPALRGSLDQRGLRLAAAHALHLDLRLEWADQGHLVAGAVELGPLVEEFSAFARQQAIPGNRRERVVRMGLDLLGKEAP